MLYCPKCRKIYGTGNAVCLDCRKNLKEITDKNTPVAVCHASGVNKDRVRAALEGQGIPTSTVAAPKSFSCEPLTGGDTTTDVIVTVPYQAYTRAYDICVGIGAVDPEDEADSSELAEDIAQKQDRLDRDAEELEEMSPAKRTTVRIVSAILLIVIFAGVIWGTDYITELLKNLF